MQFFRIENILHHNIYISVMMHTFLNETKTSNSELFLKHHSNKIKK